MTRFLLFVLLLGLIACKKDNTPSQQSNGPIIVSMARLGEPTLYYTYDGLGRIVHIQGSKTVGTVKTTETYDISYSEGQFSIESKREAAEVGGIYYTCIPLRTTGKLDAQGRILSALSVRPDRTDISIRENFTFDSNGLKTHSVHNEVHYDTGELRSSTTNETTYFWEDGKITFFTQDKESNDGHSRMKTNICNKRSYYPIRNTTHLAFLSNEPEVNATQITLAPGQMELYEQLGFLGDFCPYLPKTWNQEITVTYWETLTSEERTEKICYDHHYSYELESDGVIKWVSCDSSVGKCLWKFTYTE